MLPEEDYYCPLSKKIFFDPVYLQCKDEKHVFENEALHDKLEETQYCPLCDTPIESKKQIQVADAIKKDINTALESGDIEAYKQYLPRYVIFNLLTDNALVMPLSRIEEILKYDYKEKSSVPKQAAIDNSNSIFSDKLTSKKGKLIRYALKIQPQRMGYFLWQSTQSSKPSNLKNIATKLINFHAFDKITINQSFSKKLGNQQQTYTVAYLLLSNPEGREILKENKTLATLLGEELSDDHIKQFLNKNTYRGSLYYLLTDEVGQEILKNHTHLQEKISNIASLDKTFLSKEITDGPYHHESLHSLYKRIFPDSPNKTVSCKLFS